jgi:prephenate dehydratase
VLSSEVGTLSEALQMLAGYDINLTKIQSLPMLGTPWKYAFFVDVTFKDAQKFYDAMETLETMVKELKIVGAYAQNRDNVPSELTNAIENGK